MDKKPEKLVPEVRFKGFTDDWEQRKLGEISKRVRNNDGRMNLPLLTISARYGWMTQQSRFSASIAGREKKNYTLLEKHQLSYNHGNSKVAIYGTVYELTNYDEALVPKVYHSFSLTPENSSKFIESYFHTKKLDAQLRKFIASTARMDGLLNISFDDFMKVKLFAPEQCEQSKISRIINLIEKLITLQQRKLKQLERLKTAMLQQLLANQRFPKVRFNDFKDSWKDYRLGEVFDEFSVKSKRENEYKLLSSTTSGMESRSGRVSGHSNIGYKVIDNGDIVLSPQNLWLGNINLNNMGKGIVSPSYHTFKIVNANPIFVNFQLKTEKMLFEYKMVSVQGASVVRRNLDMDAFKKIVIKIPNEKEQIKIASLFSSISNIINNHQNKLTQLSTLKKYLLQKMFI